MTAGAIRAGVLLVVLGTCLAACADKSEKSKQAAAAVADRFYHALSQSNIEAATAFYDADFAEKDGRDAVDKLKMAVTRLGKYRSRALADWRAFTGDGPAGSGTYITLVYNVRYSRNEIMEELVFKDISGKGPKIIRHTIDTEHKVIQ
jgi:hypothetical protein